MAVSLLTARTEVRSLLDEANPVYWANSELNSWINQGCQDVARRAEILRQKVAISVVALTQNYNAPLDIYRLYRAEFVPSNGSFIYPLQFMGYQEADQIWGVYQSFPAAWPEIYTMWGDPTASGPAPATALQMYVRLFPVPAQAGTLNLFYYRQVVLAAADGDIIDTITGWEDIVYEYAVYKAKRKAHDPSWQDAKALYEQSVIDMMNTTRDFTDQPGAFTTGQYQWPPWAAGDSDWT